MHIKPDASFFFAKASLNCQCGFKKDFRPLTTFEKRKASVDKDEAYSDLSSNSFFPARQNILGNVQKSHKSG